MSYDVDGIFRFKKFDNGYMVEAYLKKDDPTITELEIPEKHKGKPVVYITDSAFIFTKHLKSAKLPKSLTSIGDEAFAGCPELERVEFNSVPLLGLNVFSCCPKLPPETVVMGILRSLDITEPLSDGVFWEMTHITPEVPDYFRPDVFELLLKNDCFRDCEWQILLWQMTRENKPELLSLAEQYGMLEDAKLLDDLLSYAIENQTTEITVYLLELKKRKFGFNGGGDFEL